MSEVTEDPKEIIENAMKAIDEMRDANDAKAKKDDALLDEKMARIEAGLAKFDDMNASLVKAQNDAKAAQEHADELDMRLNRPDAVASSPEANKEFHENWVRAVHNAHVRGENNLSDNQREALNRAKEFNAGLTVGTDTAGGYLAPPEYVKEIIKGVTEMSPVRSLMRVRRTGLKSIIIPSRTGQFAAQWVAESGTRSETTGLTFGQKEIPTHELYALIDLSEQNFEDSAFDMEEFIREESSEQFAAAEGTAVVTGNGVGRPEGFMTNGDVGTTNSGNATLITADGLLDMKHAIKTAYTANSHYVLNRTSLGAVRKLKDGNGAYIWQAGLALGKPNTIDGDPYVEFPDMPDQGAGLKPVAYGDFRRAYTMADRIQMVMLRDPYTQATSGNIRYILRRRLGGQVVLPEAIRTMTCSA